MITCLF